MTYFTGPSELAFVLLFVGLTISILSLLATINTAAVRPGSPATVAHRVGGLAGAALVMAGAVPLLFGPVQALLEMAVR